MGFHAYELLRPTRSVLKATPRGWLISMIGKGSRTRKVPVPKRCIEATRRYFAHRGLDFEGSERVTPLLASTTGSERIGYASLNETFTRFVRRATK